MQAMHLRRRLQQIRGHGLYGTLQMTLDKLHTKARFRPSKLVRRPAHVRGRAHIVFGKGVVIGPGLRAEAFPQAPGTGTLITIGEGSILNDYVHIGAARGVTIGKNVTFGSKIWVSDHDHGSYGSNGVHDDPMTHAMERPWRIAPVSIGDYAYIGENCVVLPGAQIGDGAVIGAGSIVSGTIPAFSLALGTPARVVKRYNFQSRTWDPV